MTLRKEHDLQLIRAVDAASRSGPAMMNQCRSRAHGFRADMDFVPMAGAERQNNVLDAVLVPEALRARVRSFRVACNEQSHVERNLQ
jgi:hypothetical protein